ncbi:MAG TPA: DUF1223 domain-containing protein [Alphaproteobacteria bacterium]|nr:DUF1223 domain-containing protein [Alphaproteobacteria bacterium]
MTPPSAKKYLGAFLPMLGIAAVMGVSASRADSETTKPVLGQEPTVVELFTSQGCSSCPPADKVLGELDQRADILALSLHVDYWDYIGWKDTFASPANTRRQRDYAHALHHRSIYTPEMIIDGLYDVVGSDRDKVNSMIDHAKAARGNRVAVDVEFSQAMVTVKIAGGHAQRPATVWLVRYDPEHTVAIGSGENRGREITYHNVVRTMTDIGTWSGAPLTITFNHRALDSMPGVESAVIVQYGKTGAILGAANFARARNRDVVTASPVAE